MLCLKLFDSDSCSEGSKHTQSQRFLNAKWQGLDGDDGDVALRPIVEALADGHVHIRDLFDDTRTAAKSFLHWVSAFKTVHSLVIVNIYICII